MTYKLENVLTLINNQRYNTKENEVDKRLIMPVFGMIHFETGIFI